MLGIEFGCIAVLLSAEHGGGDDVHAEPPEFVLDGGEPLLGRRQLRYGDHDADVLLEHVPVAGDDRGEERVVIGGFRQVQGSTRTA